MAYNRWILSKESPEVLGAIVRKAACTPNDDNRGGHIRCAVETVGFAEDDLRTAIDKFEAMQEARRVRDDILGLSSSAVSKPGEIW